MRHPRQDVIETDGAIIVGAGIAGLFAALKLAPFPTLVLARSRPGTSGSSIWAQGGIAAALGADDSWELHAADTITAGAGMGDSEVAAFVAREAPTRIDDLLSFGVSFDRARDGKLALAREAAHSRSRIVHVSGDRAGAEIMRALAGAASAASAVSVIENVQAVGLATCEGRVIGVYGQRIPGEQPTLFRGRSVILASGGMGALYSVTTNPADARGEGLGMAARAGAVIADAEFVQFHPTAMKLGRDPAPLATEALRGEGAVLIDEQGRRFMPDFHPEAELAPRDVVARAIFHEMARGHSVFLDCRAAPGDRFASEFPTVYGACRSAGIDPAKEPVPVAPAAHYHMGGVATDHFGRSSLPGLWCVGECASTGLHGANRLASNSLLEALVFGARVAKAVCAETNQSAPRIDQSALPRGNQPLPEGFRDGMMQWVGLERDETGLKKALSMIAAAEHAGEGEPSNSVATAKLIAAAALCRRESIGAHFRTDHPDTPHVRKRTFLTLSDAETIAGESGMKNSTSRRVHQ